MNKFLPLPVQQQVFQQHYHPYDPTLFSALHSLLKPKKNMNYLLDKKSEVCVLISPQKEVKSRKVKILPKIKKSKKNWTQNQSKLKI